MVLCALILVSHVMGATADTRNVHGLNFFADKIEPADNSHVILTLFGSTVILKEESVDARIVREYFKRADIREKFSSEDIESFVSKALSAGDIVSASKGLELLLGDKERDERTQVGLLSEIEGEKGGIELFKSLLSGYSASSSISLRNIYILEVLTGKSDFSWIKANVPVLHAKSLKEFEEVLADLFVSDLKEERRDSARSIITFSRRLLGASNKTVTDLKYIFDQSQIVAQSSKKGDVEKILPLFEVSKRDPLMRRALGGYLYEQLHVAARAVLDNGQPEKTIKILSHIQDSAEWTPSTFSLVLESLQKLSIEKRGVLLDPEVSHFLALLSERDQGLYRYLIKLLEGHIKYLARSNEGVSQAEDFFELFSTINKKGLADSDNIKFALALAYLDNDKSLRAREMIQQMQSGPGIFGHLRLLFSGYYVNIYALIFLILIPIVIFIPAILRVRSILFEADQRAAQRGFAGGNEQILSQAKSILDVSSGMHPRRIEYQELLSIFELDDSAKEKEIKAAYRAQIKKVHPDIRSEDDVKNSEEFIKITSAYERIIELRKLLKLKS